MTQGWVYFGADIALPTLLELLTGTFAAGAFWLGTSPGWADLGRAPDGRATVALPDDWPRGQVFAPQAEVRWEQEATPAGAPVLFRVWLLTEGQVLPPAGSGLQRLADDWTVAAAAPALYLWGQYQESFGAWVEVRLPRLLHYPVDAGRRRQNEFAKVRHLTYQASNGAVQFTRLVEVL